MMVAFATPIGKRKALTPSPREKGESITMNFPDAMREVIKGNKVRRMSWPEGDYSILKNGWLTVHTKGKYSTWLVSDGDMVDTEDWIVIREN
jgi:hypothetical protein